MDPCLRASRSVDYAYPSPDNQVSGLGSARRAMNIMQNWDTSFSGLEDVPEPAVSVNEKLLARICSCQWTAITVASTLTTVYVLLGPCHAATSDWTN
ncbi:hypothetical protein PM082_010004 [Marasmius tenuissimus]|nr:hypothetical protein PM082_010004 [Marasmius tenuissimus]